MEHISADLPRDRLIHATQLDGSPYQRTACGIAAAMTLALEYKRITGFTIEGLAKKWDPDINGIPDFQLAELITKEFGLPAVVGQPGNPCILAVDYGKIPPLLRPEYLRYEMKAPHWLTVQRLREGFLVSDPQFPARHPHGVYRISADDLMRAADYMGLPAMQHTVSVARKRELEAIDGLQE